MVVDKMPTPLGAFFISSFVGEKSAGNSHLVMCYSTDRSLLLAHILMLSRAAFPHILVLLNIPSSQATISVRFFQGGTEVQRCGSGSVAAAFVLRTHFSQHRAITLHAQTPVMVGHHADRYYYESPTLSYFPAKITGLWSNIINRPVKSLTLVGNQNDYCIVELNSEKAVRECRVNPTKLRLASRRALIVTSQSQSFRFDYVLRYFNPRADIYEDKATGSANAMLAPFWQNRLSRPNLHGRQLSSSGGEFKVEKKGSHQRVWGEVKEQALPVPIQRELSYLPTAQPPN